MTGHAKAVAEAICVINQSNRSFVVLSYNEAKGEPTDIQVCEYGTGINSVGVLLAVASVLLKGTPEAQRRHYIDALLETMERHD